MHLIQCQTSADIWGIVNEFVQYVQNGFQYVYIPIQPTVGGKNKLKVMIRNQKVKETFLLGLLFSKWMGLFRSSLDCFSIGG